MRRFLPCLWLVLLVGAVFAKAYHANRREMIERASFIALVEVEKPQACDYRGKTWTYGMRARARVLQRIKGDLPADIDLYGQENFECAQVTLRAGRCLVFLEREGKGYRGCNWGASCLPVDASNRVAWLAGPESRHSDCQRPLAQVLAEIEAVLGPVTPR
jgi:hypothetical protein